MCYLQFKQIELNIYNNNNNKATKKNHIFLNPFFWHFCWKFVVFKNRNWKQEDNRFLTYFSSIHHNIIFFHLWVVIGRGSLIHSIPYFYHLWVLFTKFVWNRLINVWWFELIFLYKEVWMIYYPSFKIITHHVLSIYLFMYLSINLSMKNQLSQKINHLKNQFFFPKLINLQSSTVYTCIYIY
jgi:hypothetical protein